ncbi:MAG: hypothetical protein HY226_01135 [Candidatus Vogelbacteria bacterium]|nr:hypothetical protein [Candidatus Vogelbacteria bacterium]
MGTTKTRNPAEAGPMRYLFWKALQYNVYNEEALADILANRHQKVKQLYSYPYEVTEKENWGDKG